MKGSDLRLMYRSFIWLTLILALSISLVAQQPQPAQKPDATLKELHVIITDNKNHSLDDVKQNDIQITENGTPQTIESFALVELPVTYGLVIDTSGSMRSQFPTIIQIGRNIIEANRFKDETFIVRFVHSDRISLVQETTSDKAQLVSSLGTLRVEGGQTAFIDAVYVSAEKLIKTGGLDEKRRKALIVISDGENRLSAHGEEELFRLLRNGDLQIFVIGLVEALDSEGGFIRKSPRERAVGLIERLAKETGGRAFFPRKDEEFIKAMAEISHDLQKQYVLGYHSTAGTSAQTLEIKVSDTPEKKKRRALFKPKYKAEEPKPVVNNKP